MMTSYITPKLILTILIFVGLIVGINPAAGSELGRAKAEAQSWAVIICDRREGDSDFKEDCDRLLEALKAAQVERFAERRHDDLEKVKRAMEMLGLE